MEVNCLSNEKFCGICWACMDYTIATICAKCPDFVDQLILARGLQKPAKPVKVVEPQFSKYGDFKSIYELTLTTTKDDPYELRTWVHKICTSAMYSYSAYVYAFELTKAGIPHVHVVLFSRAKYCDGTKIKSTLKYPYRYEFKRVRNPDAYVSYVQKELDTPDVNDYCAKKGILQMEEIIRNK